MQGELADMHIELKQATGKASSLAANVPVNISIETGFGLAMDGVGNGCLMINENGSSSRLTFKVRALTLNPAPQADQWQGKLHIECMYLGSPLGVLSLSPTIYKVAGGHKPAQQTKPELALSPGAKAPPDLTLIIRQEKEQGQPAIWVRLIQGSQQGSQSDFGPVLLNVPPEQYFLDLLREIEQLQRGAQDMQVAEDIVASLGVRIYENLFPEALRELLWARREEIKSIQILSEESSIPWEILRFSGCENGVQVEGKFFCEYILTHWLPKVSRRPVVRLEPMAVVVPADTGLPNADVEYQLLQDLEQRFPGVMKLTRIPGTYREVAKLFSAQTYHGLHFIGHSRFLREGTSHSCLILENNIQFPAENLVGRMANCGRLHPLVFLNSCRSAVGDLALTSLDGWGPQFIRIGAAAFLGSMWAIADTSAGVFAGEFYKTLLEGGTVGVAVLAARMAIRALNPLSWLAYTVYCDPEARLKIEKVVA